MMNVDAPSADYKARRTPHVRLAGFSWLRILIERSTPAYRGAQGARVHFITCVGGGTHMREAVTTPNAPIPIGPYSQAIKANGFVFVAGQGPLDPTTGQIVPGGIEEQTHLTLRTIKAILEAAGTSLENVVRVGVFLRDMADFAAMNKVYSEYFGATKPARTTVRAESPVDIRIEIDCIAVMPEK